MAGQATTLPGETPEPPALATRLAAVVAMLLMLAVVLLAIHRAGGGRWGQAGSFALSADGAYENLNVARELALNVSRGSGRLGGATPLVSASSPAWVLGMAGLLRLPSVAGSGADVERLVLVPLVINMVGAAVLLLLAGHLVRNEIRGAAAMFLFLVVLGVAMPLPGAVMSGMEHVVHAVVLLLAVGAALASVGREGPSVWLTLAAMALAAAGVALRYETLAVTMALLAWAWIQRRAGRLLLPTAAAAGTVALIGAYLAANQGSIVPNPVLVHLGQLFEGTWRDWAGDLLRNARANPRQAIAPWVLLVMGTVLLAAMRSQVHGSDAQARERAGWLFVFVVAGLAHLLFGPTGEQGRHEAYLVPLGLVAVGRTVAGIFAAPAVPAASGRPDSRGRVLVTLAWAAPLVIIGLPVLRAAASAPEASRNAYVRERVAAGFVRTYFGETAVGCNQPGLLGLETSARLVDLSGRTSTEVARARFQGRWTASRALDVVAAARAQLVLLAGAGDDVPVPEIWHEIGGWHRAGQDRRSASAVRVFAVSPPVEADVRIALQLLSEQPMGGVEFWFSGPAPASRPGGAEAGSKSGGPRGAAAD